MAKTLLQRRRNLAPSSITATAVTSTSSAAVSAGGSNRRLLVINPSTDCYIRFGLSSVSAATSSDFPLYADNEYKFGVGADITHYRVIRKSADGTLDVQVL